MEYRNLTPAQVDRTKAFKHMLREVETSSIEQALENFDKDGDLEREIVVWETMANVYEEKVLSGGVSLLEE